MSNIRKPIVTLQGNQYRMTLYGADQHSYGHFVVLEGEHYNPKRIVYKVDNLVDAIKYMAAQWGCDEATMDDLVIAGMEAA